MAYYLSWLISELSNPIVDEFGNFLVDETNSYIIWA